MLLKHRKLKIGLSLFLVAIVVFTLVLWRENIAHKQKYGAQIDSLSPNLARELSTDEYKKESGKLIDILTRETPRVAIEVLKKDSAENPSISRSCHEMLHDLGRAAYKKYQDFGKAISYMDDYCISGYIHGVIETYFYQKQDLVKSIKTICTAYPEDTHTSWECYHGIGHGLMYFTENNLTASLTYCDVAPNKSARSACANGVYMENFNADTKLHPSTFLKADDNFYPCNGSFNYKPDCYMNAPIHYLKINEYNYKSAIDWCSGAESDFQNDCYYGVGAQAARRNIDNKEFLSTLCSYANLEHRFSCIKGILSTYIGYYNGTVEAYALCEKFGTIEKKFCEEFIPSFRI